MSMPAELVDNSVTVEKLLDGLAPAPAIGITGIAADSRKVRPGYLFLACQGATSHGLDFVAQAESAGAAAIAWDASTGSATESDLPMIAVDGLATHLGQIANRWYNSPSSTVKVTGVTGTNGKTTVAYLVAQALMKLDQRCGYIGTLGNGIEQIGGDDSMTTPACLDLHNTLAAFRDDRTTHAAMEVSSHAIEQSRIDGITFDSAIFTNLSRDHIDYHGSMQAYFESKAALFLDRDVRNRIVSLDTDYGVELANRCGANVVTVSSHRDRVANGRPHVFVRSVVADAAGSTVGIRSSWGETELHVPLPGDFNVANALQVFALLLCNDVPIDEANAAISKVNAPPGRMERVNSSIDDGAPLVYVDYSHTPASLEAALKALRLHCPGQLWCVFGCGGDRDRGKRPMMGRVAERLADYAIVTSDNPRTEPPGQIIDDILNAMGDGTTAISDRAEAIMHAINNAGSDDIVLIAGKGHENYQVIGDETISFLDSGVAKECLGARSSTGK